MLTKQLREMERQATVTTTRVQRFIELQNQINDQIDQHGEADAQLIGELNILGDQLTNDEIHQVFEWYDDQHQKVEDDEDIEWMIE